jgi:hypothetical protein
MKPRIPLSTLCLLVAVVALTLSVFLLTARHNAQLVAHTQRHNAQLIEQAARHGAQLVAQTARHNAQLVAQTARHNAQLLDQAAEFRKERNRIPEKPSETASKR